jgi:GT2 family glycosyltransferase
MCRQLPNISVVVPVYNARQTLKACIQSLLSLQYEAGCELIFVDNGSTDGSAEILKSFAGRIQVLHQAKRGAGAARNWGIRQARFPVVAFIDSDCEADPYWLRHLAAPLEDPQTGISGGAILAKRPCNRVEKFGESIHDNEKAITCYRPPYVDTANAAARKEVLEAVGGFDETFLRQQDVELSVRMLKAGYRFAYARDAVVHHRNESTYWGLCREGFTHGLHAIAVLEKHRGFYRGAGYRPLRLKPYRRLLGHLWDCLTGADSATALCHLIFNAGTRLGRLSGAVRCGALHL